MIREEKLWWFVRHPQNKLFVRRFGFHQFLSSNFDKCDKMLGFSTVWYFGALVVVAADMLCFMLMWLQLDERASQLRQWFPWSKTQRSSKVEIVCSDKFCGNQGVCFEKLHDFYFPSMKSSWWRKICPKISNIIMHHGAALDQRSVTVDAQLKSNQRKCSVWCFCRNSRKFYTKWDKTINTNFCSCLFLTHCGVSDDLRRWACIFCMN